MPMLQPGKLSPEDLEELVFSRLGRGDSRVLVGPGEGVDAAAIDFGERVLVASTDSITGAAEDVGFYAVHVNANDVATFGARPRWFLLTVMLPEGADKALLARIMDDVRAATSSLNVVVVGGHTEVTPGLDRPIVVGTMLGEAKREKLVTSGGARAGDAIILTKWAGLEGTSIIARERENELVDAFGRAFVESAKSLIQLISVVEEGLTAGEVGVHAMHDPTEGGLANGLHEMADAARLGFTIDAQKIPIRNETRKICEFYGLNPLGLVSSGALLIAAPPDKADEVVRELEEKGIPAAVIGEFLADSGVRTISGEPLPRPESDELWKVVS